MNITREELAARMAEKTDQQLRDIFARPADWSSQALDAARAELQKRNIPPIEIASQPATDELLRRASRMYSLDEEARLTLTAELERQSIGPDEIQSYIDSEAAKTTSPMEEIPMQTAGTKGRTKRLIAAILTLLVGPLSLGIGNGDPGRPSGLSLLILVGAIAAGCFALAGRPRGINIVTVIVAFYVIVRNGVDAFLDNFVFAFLVRGGLAALLGIIASILIYKPGGAARSTPHG